jgi:2-isopropylmalate synthase
MKIEIYDSTLREGAQGAGVVFSDYEKEKIIAMLDTLGISCIETGFYGHGCNDSLLTLPSRVELHNARLSLLCPTRRADSRAEDEDYLLRIAASDYPTVAVVGKSSLYHVTRVLGTTPEENLSMIRDTVAYLTAAGKRVVFDAEHFFDGFAEDREHALSVVNAACEAGAHTVALCDTNGGMLPETVTEVVSAVVAAVPNVAVGVHCHNDIGMADACTVAAVAAGAVQAQCTVSGIGERCGNANLSTVLPVLQLKLGYDCIPADNMNRLSSVARGICQTANLGFDDSEPFVGGHAFTHKAGLHIDAVKKRPRSFEHISPDTVGNRRTLVISELSGRAAVSEILDRFGIDIPRDDARLTTVLEAIRNAEAKGYQYENSEASLLLLICRTLGIIKAPYELRDFKLLLGGKADEANPNHWSAIVKIAVDGEEELRVAEGDGPVNALDIAAHAALRRFFPYIDKIKMVDIKSRIDSNDSAASASIVRVFVESGDGESLWRTMGASTDIIQASWQALLDAFEYYILRNSDGLPGKAE